MIAVLQQGYHNIAALEPIAEREARLPWRGIVAGAVEQPRWAAEHDRLVHHEGWRSLSSKSPSRLECPSGSYIGGNVISPVAAIRLRLFSRSFAG